MKKETMEKLQSKTALFWLDGVLSFMPILTFLIGGMIGSALGVSEGFFAWFLVLFPVSLTGVWAVWYYGIRSKLNIPEEQPLFWKLFGHIV